MFEKLLQWLLVSSKDASKYSLSVKASIVFAIPAILYWTGLTCKLGIICLSVDADALQTVATILGDVVLGLLTLISGAVALYGWVRKIYRTAQGTNEALG